LAIIVEANKLVRQTASHSSSPNLTSPNTLVDRHIEFQGRLMKRWREQRWLLDNVIRANGVDWDQPRTVYLAAPCGLQAAPDFDQT
jgi:hypothetical protein